MKKDPKAFQPKRCVMCDAQFANLEQLMKHMKENHQGKSPFKEDAGK